VKNFHFCVPPKQFLGTNQLSTQLVPETAYPGVKLPEREADRLSTKIHFLICLHGVVLSQLSEGTNLPFILPRLSIERESRLTAQSRQRNLLEITRTILRRQSQSIEVCILTTG
jgi:hypothetical protein